MINIKYSKLNMQVYGKMYVKKTIDSNQTY